MTKIVVAQAGEKILLAEKLLAVIGGAVMGALLVGLLTQLLTRAFTAQKLPRWSQLTVRLLGAVLGGWLVALWVLGGGGAGFGFGSGSGQTEGQKTGEVGNKDRDAKHAGNVWKAPVSEIMRIEVLNKNTLSESDSQAKRWYRIEMIEGLQLQTFAEIKQAIKNRQQENPPLLRIEIVLYKDSPDKQLPVVSDLQTWARELNDGKMKVDISQPDADAPRK